METVFDASNPIPDAICTEPKCNSTIRRTREVVCFNKRGNSYYKTVSTPRHFQETNDSYWQEGVREICHNCHRRLVMRNVRRVLSSKQFRRPIHLS